MDCFYCEKGEKLNQLMLHICDLRVSRVFLVRNQNFPGRCVVQYKDHLTELFQLSKEDLQAFGEDVSRTARAVWEAFGPDKINYGIFGDGVPHLHVHIIPKKEGGYCWGGQFDMNGQPDYPDEAVLMERAAKIRDLLAEI